MTPEVDLQEFKPLLDVKFNELDPTPEVDVNFDEVDITPQIDVIGNL